MTFDTTQTQAVQVQVGISFVSIANAEANYQAENAHWNFATAQSNANDAWNARLNTIQVQGGTPDEQTTFYTALYHVFFHPNIFTDVNGQYLGFDNKVHTAPAGHAQYENISSWDLYHSAVQLRTILAPTEMDDILQSLVNDAQQGDGHLPRWEQENADSRGMVGDGADIFIADGYAFGATNFNTSAALGAMIDGQSKVRDGLSDYIGKGYMVML